MDKMREEFEVWASEFFGLRFDGMTFSKDDFDTMERYHCISDDYGAFVVTGMFYAWQASRAALCVELPDNINGEYYADGWNACLECVEGRLEDAGVSHK